MIKRSAVKNILKPELLSVISDGSTAASRHGGLEFCAENASITEEGCYTATMRKTRISRRFIRSTQRAVHLTGALLLFAGSSVHAATPKAVFILLDGIPADLVESVSTPFFDEIAKDGSCARAHVGGQTDRERTIWIATNSTALNERFSNLAGIVDILLSILTHLEIAVPQAVRGQFDGKSFIDARRPREP